MTPLYQITGAPLGVALLYCSESVKPIELPMALELGNLKKAIQSLGNAITVHSDPKSPVRSAAERDVIRAGVIQNFEFTYELCWKFMKRWLEANVSPTMDGLTRKELFRLAAENKLISKVESWMLYHQSRNETSHAYDEETAEDVYASIAPFLEDAKSLLLALEARND